MRRRSEVLCAALAVMALAAPAVAQSSATARQRAAEQAREAAARAKQQAAREAAQERARRQRAAAEEARERQMRNWPEVTETVSRTARIGRNGTFELENMSGNVVVTGGGGDQVRIEAVKRARSPQEASARAALQALEVEISERGGNVGVRTGYPRNTRNTFAAVDYTVALPSSVNVVISTMSGDVRVTNLSGELRANAMSGNVSTSAVRRVRQVSTVSGNVEVTDGEADELTASTIGGDILLRNVKGRVLELSTVNGDARLVDVELDRATLHSMAGDLDFAGRLARNGRYEFQTHSGNIRVSPAGNPGFDLDASSFSGDVRTDFALKATAPAERGPQRSLRGTFGNAGAVVSAQSFAGDILILRR